MKKESTKLAPAFIYVPWKILIPCKVNDSALHQWG